MGKAKMVGANKSYIPNAKADMRFCKMVYQHGREIAKRDPPSTRAQRQDLKRMEEMKRGRPTV